MHTTRAYSQPLRYESVSTDRTRVFNFLIAMSLKIHVLVRCISRKRLKFNSLSISLSSETVDVLGLDVANH
jgi:hypothetical protein